MKIIKTNGLILYPTEFKGYYCTKDGRIFSIKIKGGRGRLDSNNPHELAYKLNKYGYLEVVISLKNEFYGKNKYIPVHKIIYETFNKKVDINNDQTIDHINNNKLDNRLENLQILSRIENCKKRNKDWVESRRHKYIITFADSNLQIGPLNRQDCYTKFGLTHSDFDRYFNQNKISSRIKNLKIELKRV